MRCRVDLDTKAFPHRLQIWVHGAPHRRQSREVLQTFRKKLNEAADAAGLEYPIEQPVDLYVLFVDPTTPDLDNSLTALYRAIDGKSLKGKSLLKDDGLIFSVKMSKFYPNGIPNN